MAQATRYRLIGALALAGFLAGCGGEGEDQPLLERLTASTYEAPEEFAVLPQKPLELPEDLSALPPPDPGGPSRTDLTPRADALRAFGGTGAGGIVAADRALLAAARTELRRPDIRALVAREDAAWRARSHGLPLDRLFGLVGEPEIYAGQVLDPEAELLRLRALGVWVPQLPPIE